MLRRIYKNSGDPIPKKKEEDRGWEVGDFIINGRGQEGSQPGSTNIKSTRRRRKKVAPLTAIKDNLRYTSRKENRYNKHP